MGKVVSTRVGDRTLQGSRQSTRGNVQVAAVSESGNENEQYPTATAVQEPTVTEGGLVQATTVTTALPQSAAEIRSTVWGERVDDDDPQPPGGNGNRARGNAPAEAGDGLTGILTLLFFGACIAIPIAAFAGAFDDDSAGLAPTAFPTPTPVDVLVCPVVFDGNSQNVQVTSCDEDICGGSIEWCSVDNTSSYRLIVSVRGDYDSPAETITLTLEGQSLVRSADEQCGAELVTILDRSFTPSSSTLLLEYQNSAAVDNICLGGLSTVLNATLIQL